MKLMSDNIATIAKALVAAQRVMGNATKDSKNPFFKSKYADLNAVREAVLPALNSNGISVLQPTIYQDGKKFVQTVFLHESGEFISGLTEILSAKELDAQAQGSGISYARRYGLQSLANVGADDDDGEGAVGRSKNLGNGAKQDTVNHGQANHGNQTQGLSSDGNGTTVTNSASPSNSKRAFRKPTTGSEDL
jgi:hypothetical protein